MTNVRPKDLYLAFMSMGFAIGLSVSHLASLAGITSGIVVLSACCAVLAGVWFYISWRRG